MSIKLDINALRALVAIDIHGGVTRAAANLALSQSAVSHKIRRLETGLGQPLLTRQAGGPLFTETGLRLLEYARRILALHDEALDGLGSKTLSGTLRLGMTEDVTSGDLAQLVGRFSRLYPDIKIRSHVRQSLVLAKELLAGTLDLGMMQIWAKDVTPADTVLFWDSLNWVATEPPGPGPVPFLSYDDDCFYKVWALEALPEADTVLECASSAGIMSAVRAGLGVALLPGTYVTNDMVVLHEYPKPPDLAYVIRMAPGNRSAAAKALRKVIATELERHPWWS